MVPIGHASKEIGDIYLKLKVDVEYRRVCCERVGLGFSIGLFGLQNKVVLIDSGAVGKINVAQVLQPRRARSSAG